MVVVATLPISTKTWSPCVVDARCKRWFMAVWVAFLVGTMSYSCAFSRSSWEFHRDLLAADRLADQARYDEARAAYRELAWRAERDDLLRYVRFRIALMYDREGQAERAMALYEDIYTSPASVYDEYAGKALYRAALIYRDVYDDMESWHAGLVATLNTYPNTTSADDALFMLRRHYVFDSEDPATFVDLVSSLYPALANTEIGDNLAYEAARTLDDHMDMCEEALDIYWHIARTYHRGGLVDDAVWRAADCYRRLGRADEEYVLLNDFIDGREVSWVMADYDSQYYAPTLRRLAEIYMERGDIQRSIDVWRRFQSTFPFSLRVDDIHYDIMLLQRELGDLDGMRRTLAMLERDWPDSRFTRRGRTLLEETERAP